MAPGRDPCLTSTTEHRVEAGSEQAKNGEHRQAGWKNAPRVGEEPRESHCSTAPATHV